MLGPGAAVSISSMEGRAGGWTVTGTVVVCGALISACGSAAGPSSTVPTRHTNLDVARVEQSIQRSILSQRHLESKVVCPAKVAQRPGKFPCIATTFAAKRPHKETKTPFVVTIHNTAGYVTYVGK
jgi:hypothetical protein